MSKIIWFCLLVSLGLAAYDPLNDLLQRQDYPRLLTVARDAVISEENARNYYYLGAAYAGVNRDKLADKAFRTALDKPDLTYSIAVNIAEYFESQNNSPQAINVYKLAFHKFPQEKVQTAQKMSKVLSKQKQHQETIDIFTDLIDTDPYTANPLAYFVGVSYYTLDNIDKAEDYFQRALDAGYRDADVYLKQGEIKVRRGQWQAGLDLLNEGIKLGGVIFTPEPNTFKYLGQAYAKLDDTRNAADNFRKSIQGGSRDLDVYLQYAANASLNRDFPGVLEMLEPHSAAYVRSGEYQYYLGNAYDNLGQAAQAVQYYQRALEAGYTNTNVVRSRISELRQNNEETN